MKDTKVKALFDELKIRRSERGRNAALSYE